MRVALVGNGPSVLGKGAEIDAHDFVIRCTGFPLVYGDSAGVKLDAWARFGCQYFIQPLMEPPTGDYSIWFTLPLSRCREIDKAHCGILENAIRAAKFRPIRFVTEEAWEEEKSHLSAVTSREHKWAAPTTGFTALDMALRILNPELITLYGFDATVEGKPGWGDAKRVVPWPPGAGGHDMLSEKRTIALLRDARMWMGKPCDTKINWPEAPC